MITIAMFPVKVDRNLVDQPEQHKKDPAAVVRGFATLHNTIDIPDSDN